ncbi:DUF3300 domain-containing protein [Pluralibacter sp.]|uniref:DUF3300 domain-containing protein n=1 Tax=Pluralibacter sp. TaxID=1920032 RepID=UPI0025F4DAEA|nr:DUF3300 domain-containing protein [Pluralibacter sp.]MBV8045034.1 DUF3300 domain-containing protein [Pluralibacter sp.]
MTLPFKPHVLAIICSAGLLAAAGTLYVKSRAPETITPAPAVTQPAPAPATAPVAAPAATTATAPAPAGTQPVTTTYTTAQIDQWVAPIALYPDNLLSQVLMASTYPTNVMQAVQWSQDNPTMQGDAAVQAVANQPWDPSVKSLVAFPQLLALMGENPPWVESLGDAFLAQPQDVMNSVQKLRALAQQTGVLKSTPQQKVTTTTKTVPAVESSSSTQSSTTTTTAAPASSTQVIKIESADPNVVYVPTYNPATAYGTWPSTAYPPVYLPPPPGEQFANSFVNGFGFSLGVATTYALFSNIDWDDDDYHHHDDYHGGGSYNRNVNNNINIDVNDFNRVTGQKLQGSNVNWQHNPSYRNNVPYPNNNVAQRFHQSNVPGGLSATQAAPTQAAANRNNQRQAAMNQFQQRTGTTGAGVAAKNANVPRDAQRQAASKQLNQITQRSNYRGYDNTPGVNNPQRREAAKNQVQRSGDQQQRREAAKNQTQRLNTQQQPQRREQVQQQRTSTAMAQRQQRSNALSGNDSRSPSWQAQRDRGMQSRNVSGANRGQRPARSEHREVRHR